MNEIVNYAGELYEVLSEDIYTVEIGNTDGSIGEVSKEGLEYTGFKIGDMVEYYCPSTNSRGRGKIKGVEHPLIWVDTPSSHLSVYFLNEIEHVIKHLVGDVVWHENNLYYIKDTREDTLLLSDMENTTVLAHVSEVTNTEFQIGDRVNYHCDMFNESGTGVINDVHVKHFILDGVEDGHVEIFNIGELSLCDDDVEIDVEETIFEYGEIVSVKSLDEILEIEGEDSWEDVLHGHLFLTEEMLDYLGKPQEVVSINSDGTVVIGGSSGYIGLSPNWVDKYEVSYEDGETVRIKTLDEILSIEGVTDWDELNGVKDSPGFREEMLDLLGELGTVIIHDDGDNLYRVSTEDYNFWYKPEWVDKYEEDVIIDVGDEVLVDGESYIFGGVLGDVMYCMDMGGFFKRINIEDLEIEVL